MPSALLAAIIAEDNLWDAFEHVRAARGGPGLDGVTVDSLAADPAPTLRRLRAELGHGTYRPWPLRRVYVPKRRGGLRPLGIGCVRDRVAQRAALQCLGPRAEPQFNATSFAYRPGIGLHDAIRAVQRGRDAGHGFVLEADIEACFDSFDRRLLRDQIDALIPEPDVRRLVDRWLQAGHVFRGTHTVPTRGVAQGDILSPLWCNLYLDRLDDALERRPGALVRYADDFVVLTKTAHGAERAREVVSETLIELKLALSPAKTRVSSFARGFEYLGVEFKGRLAIPLARELVLGPDGVWREVAVPVYELDLPRADWRQPDGRRKLTAGLDRAAARAARRGKRLSSMAEAFREALGAEVL